MKLTFLAVVVFVVATMFGIVEAEQGEQRDLVSNHDDSVCREHDAI